MGKKPYEDKQEANKEILRLEGCVHTLVYQLKDGRDDWSNPVYK